MFEAQLEGRSGVGADQPLRRPPLPDASSPPRSRTSTWAASSPTPAAGQYSGLNSQFAAAAAQQALDTPACSIDAARVDRNRFGVYLGCGEGIQDFHNLMSLIAEAYVVEERRVDAPTFCRDGLREFHARQRGRTGTAHHARPPGRPLRPARAELQLPDGLRRQQPGHRRGRRDDPPRRRRPDARRRLAQHDPSVRRHRLQPPDRPVHAQRRRRRRRRGRST